MEAQVIEHLEKSTTSRLRSGIAIDSVTQCIDELVTNSIDAGASCIAVRINIGILRFQVVDNGCGLTEDQLSSIGERYATSKCNDLSDLERLDKFGFRGEALASLRDLSSILEIESKSESSSKSFSKVFSNSNRSEVFRGKQDRASEGTTVTVHSLFYNLPVRQKRIIESLEVESIRYRLAAIALIHPKISFSLRDDSSNSVILQTRRTGSIKRSFAALFSDRKACFLKEVNYSNGEFNIEGLIGTEGHHNKNLQFMYVNGRLLLKTKLHKLVNTLLSKSLITSKRSWHASEKNPASSNYVINANSPGKATDQYGIFVLDIRCPLADYEITLDPRKTLVEFKEWDKIIVSCSQLVNQFLIRENLTMAIEDVTTETELYKPDDDQVSPITKYDLHKDFAYCSGVERYGKAISTSSCTSTLQSLIVKRPSDVEIQISELKDVIGFDAHNSQDAVDGTNVQNNSLQHQDNIKSQYVDELDIKSFTLNQELSVSEISSRTDSVPDQTCPSLKETRLCQEYTNQPSSSDSETASELAIETDESLDIDNGCSNNITSNVKMTPVDGLSVNVKDQHILTPLEILAEDNGCNYNTSNLQKTQLSTLSLRTNGQEIVKELEVLEKDCHQNSTKLVEHDFSSDDASANIAVPSTTLQSQCSDSKTELSRKTFKEVSGRDLLEDLVKMDADSQESVEEEEICCENRDNLHEGQNSFPERVVGYTNSLQMFKLSACKSAQPLLTRKLKQQKKSDKPQADKQEISVVARKCVEKNDVHESDKVVHGAIILDEEWNINHQRSKFNQPNSKSLISKSFRRKPHHLGSYKRPMEITLLRNLHKYKRNVTATQSVIKKSSASDHQITKIIPVSDQTSKDNKQSRFFSSAQLFDTNHTKIGERNDHMTSSQLLQTAQKKFNRRTSSINDHGKLNEKSDPDNEFMSSSQFMDTAQKRVGRERLTPIVQSGPEFHRILKPVYSKTNNSIIPLDEQVNDCDKQMVDKDSNNNIETEAKDVGNHFDNTIDLLQTDSRRTEEPFSYITDDRSILQGSNLSDNDVGKDLLQGNVVEEASIGCRAGGEGDVDMHQISNLLDKDIGKYEDVQYITEVISANGDSITADDIHQSMGNSTDEIWSDAVDLEAVKCPAGAEASLIAKGSRHTILTDDLSTFSKYVVEDISSNKCTDDVVHASLVDKNNILGLNSETDKIQADFETTINSISDDNHEDNLITSGAASNTSGEPVSGKEACGTNASLASSSTCETSSNPSTCDQNLFDDITDVNDNMGWLCHFDQRLGKRVYVNKITGNSQYVEPKLDDTICIKDMKRAHRFLTHNATPFLPRTKKQRQSFNPHGTSGEDDNASSSEGATTALQNMVDDHLNELVEDVGCKWKDISDLIKTGNGSGLDNLVTDWNSSCSTSSLREKDVVNVCVGDAARSAVRVHSAMHQYNFTKEMLSNVEILGQLDNKFIACLMTSEGKATGVKPNLLVLIDQHAAHERVRLERLTADAVESDEDEIRIQSSKVNPAITVALSSEEVRLIRDFHAKFANVGLRLDCIDENSVQVTGVPACLVEHDASEVRHGRKPVTYSVTLIKEQLTLWTQTLGASATLPQTIIRVLNSQACHGAIKFGDALDLAQCKSLVGELARCDLPFQCAHGRPSLMPILDFDLMRPVPDLELSSKPHLWRLKKAQTRRNETEPVDQQQPL